MLSNVSSTARLLAVALAFPFSGLFQNTFAQRPANEPDAAHILHDMEKLPMVGAVLYIAAHPDDENTKLIAWLSNGKKVRTGYLSLTRGDGGQDLLGPELGDALGIIRTEELLAARRIDGGEQFFTRASDFGYSKNAKESFEKWGHDEVLSDVVRVIRTFRPDVIITRFPPTNEAGHGHHEASAILAHEAFDMAGDPEAFPEQLEQGLTVWQPRRLYFNGSTWWKKDLADIAERNKDWYPVDVGGFDPLLGLSYTELAGRSRSMHKSQGFGAAETRGQQMEYLHFDLGDRPKSDDIFDGIDMTWERVPGGEAVATAVDALLAGYDLRAPEKSVEALGRVASAVDALPPSDWKDLTRKRVNELLLDVTGTVVEALSDAPQVVTGDSVKVALNVLTRSASPVQFVKPDGNAVALADNAPFTLPVGLKAPLTPDQPFWLALPHGNLFHIADPTLIGKAITPPELEVPYTLRIAGGTEVKGIAPVLYGFVDRLKGEQVQTCEVVPPVSLFASPYVLMVKDTTTVAHLGVEAYTDLTHAELIGERVADWEFTPARQQLGPLKQDQRIGASLRVVPEGATRNTLPYLRMDVGHPGPTDLTRRIIGYDHIPKRSWYTKATFCAVPIDVKVNAQHIGYIMGAGDDVPQALEQLGLTVDLIDPATATLQSLSKYDAIVTGIRAYNVTHALKELNPVLMEYVKNGGTLVDQYTTLSKDMVLPGPSIGPYPFAITRDRVTVEEATPTFLDPKNPLLNTPNKITLKDFDDWVQERGLYFLGDLDPHYTPLIGWSDPGEKQLDGALVTCDYGKGRFVYTGISFFRQLPTGVPGAYRLFANLISRRSAQ
ncbi:MAG TPA: PIG-L family deacetylase [Flavobacteriales bacterium]|jgi:LmbE family N-acetylglucosaminyl deacetylase|nr:PIG-L family deacetylase [Flavobacteriales bacterium]MBK7286808.1 PIG-L family deacetylase [Flavobacteriales bacterium]QQS72326.1 MAG: PIG-L family deacetylase [Flavobacteriales bacterium]HQV39628.1 PIG-L family deacetylase [Flavobacteriales bacterium]HQW33128.1 PIG-L family deacetylase [Flavobacteriales bacterium]